MAAAINTRKFIVTSAYQSSPNLVNIIFSYNENFFMEVIYVSNIPDSEFLTSSNIENIVTEKNYHVRIINTSGNILVESFITEEKPVAISEKYLLTEVVSNGVIWYEKRQFEVNKTYILVRSMANLRGNIIKTIESPKHDIIIRDNDISTGEVILHGVIPGPIETFLFIYDKIYMEYSGYKPKMTIIKYNAVEYGNMEEFLEDKLT